MFRPMKPYQLVVDVSVAAAFALVALWSELQGGAVDGPTGVLASVLTCVLLAIALAVRRLSPGLALALAWVGAIVQMTFGRPPIFADVAIFAVLYTAAAYGSRFVFWAGFASSILGAVVITSYLFLIPDFAGGRLSLASLPLALAVLVAAGFALLLSWTVGALVRTAIRARESRAAAARAEAEATAEQERVRIARDMHDVVAHSLTVVIAQADGARYAAASNPDAATDALATISTTARAALADVRLLLTQLRHSQTDGPQPTLADLDELYAQVRVAGVDLIVDVDPAPPAEPPAAVQLALFRIVQEALTNALRHGDSTAPVAVRLAWLPTVARGAAGVEFEVRNGLKPGHRPTDTGHGMIGMGERASLVGGWLNSADRDGAFVVNGVLPVGGAA
ncbi:histidine kinase [Microbacterium lacus]|uniref:sensor histidine kinase n=1 Tax=Microbacterium lacus TaxID=415217 RepID=UPI00384CAAAC